MNTIFNPYLDRIEQAIKTALPKDPASQWIKDSFGTYDAPLKKEYIAPLTDPTSGLVNLGGKRWRPLLLVLCAEACSIRNGLTPQQTEFVLDNAYKLTPLVEFVHTASLIHDDIEDSSDTRRGQPAAYITYGMDTAINAGSWLYFEAPVCIQNLDISDQLKLKLYDIYTMELRRLHLGQSMDILWHRNKTTFITKDEYLTMVKSKTGTLSSFAAKVGSMIALSDTETVDLYGKTASQIGAGFQIIDDVINLTIGNPGKKRGDDIVEGKLSLPVIMFKTKMGQSSSEVKALEDCFIHASQEGIDSPYVDKAISILEASGCINQARDEGIALINRSLQDLESISGKNQPMDLIKDLFISMIPKGIQQQLPINKEGTDA